MPKAQHFIDAPRIQIVLVPESERNINSPSALFDIWLVLHMPDGKPPTTVRINGGPYDRDSAAMRLATIWGELGERHTDQTALPPLRPS
jgi:hypothetical protein